MSDCADHMRGASISEPDALVTALGLAREDLTGLPHRPVGGTASLASLRAALSEPLPEQRADAVSVVRELARAADPGLVASAGPRFFGFVTGGTLPAALAADWLTSVWDQNAGLYVESPAASVVEDAAAVWLLELFGLPPTAEQLTAEPKTHTTGRVRGCGGNRSSAAVRTPYAHRIFWRPHVPRTS